MQTGSPLQIGSLVFEHVDQLDVTGPFEILAQLPNAVCRLYSEHGGPVRDYNGFVLTPDGSIADAPQLDVLHVPGGPGQEAVMTNAVVLDWIVRQAGQARLVLSVCTGALICGAAGLLEGRRATTHWSARRLLPMFGAWPIEARIVEEGNMIFSSGVTGGIDAALLAAARLRGAEVAQAIQLAIEYAPQPPFDAGAPSAAPAAVVERAVIAGAKLSARRLATAERYAREKQTRSSNSG